MRTGYDAIVVGARCAAGPSTAMLLARAGYRVLGVGKATFPVTPYRHTSCIPAASLPWREGDSVNGSPRPLPREAFCARPSSRVLKRRDWCPWRLPGEGSTGVCERAALASSLHEVGDVSVLNRRLA
jgi:hypothetical protein